MYTDNEIEDEVKKRGNTNFITDAKLSSGAQIFAIGDSHSIFFYNSLIIKEHWFFNCNLPLTIYRLLNEDLDILNIGNTLKNGHELYNIKSKDYVLFFFGYNDIQKNIYLYAQNNWKTEILNLMTNFIKKVVLFKHSININPIIPCIYPNPREDARGVNSQGTHEERRNYTIYANEILTILCKFNDIPFLNIYDLITDNEGYIKESITKDSIHLDYDNKSIKNIIEKEILKFCI